MQQTKKTTTIIKLSDLKKNPEKLNRIIFLKYNSSVQAITDFSIKLTNFWILGTCYENQFTELLKNNLIIANTINQSNITYSQLKNNEMNELDLTKLQNSQKIIKFLNGKNINQINNIKETTEETLKFQIVNNFDNTYSKNLIYCCFLHPTKEQKQSNWTYTIKTFCQTIKMLCKELENINNNDFSTNELNETQLLFVPKTIKNIDKYEKILTTNEKNYLFIPIKNYESIELVQKKWLENIKIMKND